MSLTIPTNSDASAMLLILLQMLKSGYDANFTKAGIEKGPYTSVYVCSEAKKEVAHTIVVSRNNKDRYRISVNEIRNGVATEIISEQAYYNSNYTAGSGERIADEAKNGRKVLLLTDYAILSADDNKNNANAKFEHADITQRLAMNCKYITPAQQ